MRSIIRQDETASALDQRTDRGGDPDRTVCQFLLGGRVRGHLVPQRARTGMWLATMYKATQTGEYNRVMYCIKESPESLNSSDLVLCHR